MTRANLTEIIVVLDRSGSMSSIQDATIESFNGYVDSQRAGVGEVRFTLIQFDDQYEVVMQAQPLAKFRPLTRKTYQPRGSTALLDAIGRTILETGQRFAQLAENERPGSVIFVIQTDGYENASTRYSGPEINRMIAQQRDTYSWQFVFLGANQDAIASAAMMGIDGQAALSYDGDSLGTKAAFSALNACTLGYRAARAAAPHLKANWAFSDEDRKDAKKNK